MGWAIYSDYSGCTEDEIGTFSSELEAQERLIGYLEGDKARTQALLTRARRRRNHLIKKAAQ